jgi:diguanylate cyclase (GGDEF)-like protein
MSKINQRENYITTLVKAPKDKFKLLFDLAPVPLIEGIWTSTFQVLNANQAALQLFSSQDRKQFDNWFPSFPSKISTKILLELLSARVKGDFFEHEVKLPTMRRSHVHVFMRVAYVPAQFAAGPQHVILAFHDVTEVRRKENFLKKLSQLDGLTGVFNRRTIMQRFDEELSRAKRYDLNLSCVLVDLDNFKKVNDQFGHLYGDKALKNAVSALKATLRKTDIIGRLGGDEFLIILPETSIDQARVPIERFLETTKTTGLITLKGQSLQISFSIGISAFPAAGLDNTRDLVKAADQVLYLSKTNGGNQCHYYNSDIHPPPKP